MVRLLLGLVVLTVGLLAGRPVAADALDDIRASGRLVVGIKGDYPVWGYRDPNGRLIGLEADLARDIAERLGVRAEIVQVTSGNRLEKLGRGEVDVVIATMGDNVKRREQATLIEPHYYSSGANVMVRKDRQIRDWEDLRGRTLCAQRGAYFNKPVRRRYGVELMLFENKRRAFASLAQDRCIGWLGDDTSIANDLLSPEWTDYEMPLNSEQLVPWTIGVGLGPQFASLTREIEDEVAEWHREGRLLQLQDTWGIPRTQFLLALNEQWTRRDADGAYVCRRGPDGAFPLDCLYVLGMAPIGRADPNAAATPPPAISPLRAWFDARGIKLTILFDDIDRADFLTGLLTTIQLALACLVTSVAIGLAGALLLGVPFFPLRWPVHAYVALFRSTPPLVQMFLLFFGISQLLPQVPDADGIPAPMFDRFFWAAMALSLYAGAPNVIIFRAAMDAVPADLKSAGSVLGLTRGQIVWEIELPLALRLAAPQIFANLINIVKATGIASAIAVPELLYVSDQIRSEEGNSTEMMNVLLMTFFLLITLLVIAMNAARRWLRVPGMGS